MKKLTSTFSFFYRCFVLYTLVCFALLYWFPFDGWFWGFVMMSFPIVIAGHLVMLLLSLFARKKKNVLLPMVMLLLGCVFMSRTYQLRDEEQEASPDEKSFKIMNYNVHGFQHSSGRNTEQLNVDKERMKEWVTGVGADVLCLPEYINYKGSGAMDVTAAIERAGYKDVVYLGKTKFNQPHSYWGMALFSKYPIVASRDTVFEMQNGMIQADIKIGKDTVRVLSVHLFSMTLRLNSLLNQRTFKGLMRESKLTARRIKHGFSNHALEVTALASWVKASPYPVIVCGDFNETPYSYVYGKSRSILKNAFEQKGSGFGFTFNEAPYFIRIDHQFYDKSKLELLQFRTVDSVRFSDHYPQIGTYKVVRGD
ncbi:endonuclease/exonuclease/phosphatase family protein [Dyadobacter sp. CY312]|uniref:endonuclease/exonuclease/phosphatase family protein n=1 Tax=Dyadobacter sp. CY312 TaxID=2907303 RepID=UPI001F18FF57|nr:endonuclease/exonuclease/phosphatase family protein [Dyadobacter sp. CY312]MCE7041435.1 endonuclease/exonuclease/phosphatase family protein [Dyadobacter sp. CY312]